MVKLVHMEVEGAHQSIRRARQRGMDAAKKAFKGGSEDERKRAEKEGGAPGCKRHARARAHKRARCEAAAWAQPSAPSFMLTCRCTARRAKRRPHAPPPPQVQKLHDQYLAEADRLRKLKDAELREHRD